MGRSLNQRLLILLQLLLQVRYLPDLAQGLLLKVCLKHFELLFSHGGSYGQLGPLFLQSLHRLLKVIDLKKAKMRVRANFS